MYSTKSYKLTTEEFNYLLPVLRRSLLSREDGRHYFIGTVEDLEDMLNRLKGWYDYYTDLDSTMIYKCSRDGNLDPFRQVVLI